MSPIDMLFVAYLFTFPKLFRMFDVPVGKKCSQYVNHFVWNVSHTQYTHFLDRIPKRKKKHFWLSWIICYFLNYLPTNLLAFHLTKKSKYNNKRSKLIIWFLKPSNVSKKDEKKTGNEKKIEKINHSKKWRTEKKNQFSSKPPELRGKVQQWNSFNNKMSGKNIGKWNCIGIRLV